MTRIAPEDRTLQDELRIVLIFKIKRSLDAILDPKLPKEAILPYCTFPLAQVDVQRIGHDRHLIQCDVEFKVRFLKDFKSLFLQLHNQDEHERKAKGGNKEIEVWKANVEIPDSKMSPCVAMCQRSRH